MSLNTVNKTGIWCSSQTKTAFSFTDPHRNICTRAISVGYILQSCSTGLDSHREDWEAWAARWFFDPYSFLRCVAHGQPCASEKHSEDADNYFCAKWSSHKWQCSYNPDHRCCVTKYYCHHSRWERGRPKCSQLSGYLNATNKKKDATGCSFQAFTP